MEALATFLANYGVPGVILLGMAACIFVLFRRMDEHESHCERYRAEMRTELKHVREDIGELCGDVRVLATEIRNGSSGCRAGNKAGAKRKTRSRKSATASRRKK